MFLGTNTNKSHQTIPYNRKKQPSHRCVPAEITLPLHRNNTVYFMAGIYLHIPFCTTKCDYCAFYSLPLSKRKDASCITDQFYEVLEKELTSVVEELKRPFRTIFIGGGNPGLLGPSRIKNLLDMGSSPSVMRI